MNEPVSCGLRNTGLRRYRLAKPHLHRCGRQDQRGSVSVLSALSLLALVGIGALAVEVATLTVARNELQNAADATAMAGAACLAARTECGNATLRKPDWDTATARALAFVPNNTVQGKALAHGSVTPGYWNMLGAVADLQATTIAPTDYDYPAIRVTLSREPGVNGGSLVLPLAYLFGVQSAVMRASAVAVLSHPGTALPSTVFPVVISRCMYETYWDGATGTPKLATATTVPGLSLPQVVGEPYRFKITSSYRAGPCAAGQWTSLGVDNNSASFLRTLIGSGNPANLSVGDLVWVQPGSQTTLYGDVNRCSEAGNRQCAYVMVPMVEQVSTHVYAPILGFACLHILSAAGGSDKSIVVQMSADAARCPRTGSGVGPNYGITLPP
ncbi:MAG: hypothetical protein RL087_902, partial [Pseudomonadota bacterium]